MNNPESPTATKTFESTAFDGARTQSVRKHSAFRTMLIRRQSSRTNEIAAIQRVAEAMQDTWDDWVGDVGRTPDFLTIHEDGSISADFAASKFAEGVAAKLKGQT